MSVSEPSIKKPVAAVSGRINDFLIKAIRVYQKIAPANHGFGLFGFYGACRFLPSCSEYSIASISKDGALTGISKGFLRILRCGPWSKGGLDLP